MSASAPPMIVIAMRKATTKAQPGNTRIAEKRKPLERPRVMLWTTSAYCANRSDVVAGSGRRCSSERVELFLGLLSAHNLHVQIRCPATL